MTRTREQRIARRAHLCALLGVQFPPDDDDGMTERDWQWSRGMAQERAQRADDAMLYGTRREYNDRNVGY